MPFLPTGPRLSGKIYRIWPIAFIRKKIHMGSTDRRTRPSATAPGAFNWFSRHMRLFWDTRSPHCGKTDVRVVHNLFTKNFSKRVDFWEIRAYSTIVGPAHFRQV
jgi:hypothetical protein